MSEMVERAARALCVDDGHDPDRTLSGGDVDPQWVKYERQARVVITALQEPTLMMVLKGMARASDDSFLESWRCMFKEALL